MYFLQTSLHNNGIKEPSLIDMTGIECFISWKIVEKHEQWIKYEEIQLKKLIINYIFNIVIGHSADIVLREDCSLVEIH